MRAPNDRTVSPGGRRLLAAMVALLLLLGAGFAGYHQIFETHTDYDDEGYVMLTLASFMAGEPLYNAVYTQYGPAPFVASEAIHRLAGLPVTHDVTRLKSLAVWLVAAALCALVVTRLTGSLAAAAAAFAGSFLHLERLCLEPGHPQELCALAVALACLLYTGHATRRLACAAGLGAVVAFVVTTKINVGALLLVSAAFAFVLAGPRDRRGNLLVLGALPLIVLLPFLVTRAHLRAPGGLVLPTVSACALAGVAVVARRVNVPPLWSWRHVGAFCGTMLVGSGGFVLAAWWRGSTPSGLWHGLIAQHLAFSQLFASPAPIPAAALPWSLAGLAGAVLVARRPRLADAARVVIACALAWSCLRHLLDTPAPLVHGAVDRGASGILTGVVTPLSWVLLVPTRTGGLRDWTGRLGLCAIACLLPLVAYPTPGTQMALASLPALLASFVALHDVERTPAHRLAFGRLAVPGLLALLAVTLLVRDVQFHDRAKALTPLALPGASRLRMSAERAARYRWLTTTLRERADTFVFAEHARDSFYFWTELPPPTGFNPTFWPFLLRPAEQARVVAALERARRPAVVHEPYASELDDGAPLRRHALTRFVPALSDGFFEVWLPRDRPDRDDEAH